MSTAIFCLNCDSLSAAGFAPPRSWARMLHRQSRFATTCTMRPSSGQSRWARDAGTSMADDTEFVRSNHAAIWGGAGATAYAPLPIRTASLNQSHSPNPARLLTTGDPVEDTLAWAPSLHRYADVDRQPRARTDREPLATDDAPNPEGLFASRLDRLFRTVHTRDRGPYTPAEVAGTT
jgi:hypothetical protein